MTDLPKRVDRAITEYQLLKRREPLIVAVSGGLDSMVLLHVLHHLVREHGWRLHVAHFNHLLRGAGSDADEVLVASTAKSLSLPFVADQADVRAFAESGKLSIEMAARQLRHKFLAGVARKHRTAKIALAHHADDQVELFFLRLLRGAGLDGLGGMRWSSSSPADPQIQLIRPLLECSKDDLRNFAADQKIVFREDPTNESRDILRNRIRHELLPLLKENYQPAISKTTARLMEIIRAESDFSEAAGSQQIPFARMPVALQRRRIQNQLITMGIAPEFDLIEALRRSETPIMVDPEQVVLRSADGRLQLRTVPRSRFDSDQLVVSLGRGNGGLIFKDVSIDWQIVPSKVSRITHRASRELFDADRIGDSIILRHWQRGDRFHPIGMAHSVKLQDFFVNQKVPQATRHKLLIAATANNEIFWVEGLRIAEPFKLDNEAKNVLEWSWRRS